MLYARAPSIKGTVGRFGYGSIGARVGFGVVRHAVACAALSPPERAAGDRDRVRRFGLSGAAAAAPSGAALHVTHPGDDPRSDSYHSAARHAEGSERFCAKARRLDRRPTWPIAGGDAVRPGAVCHCAACRTALRIVRRARHGVDRDRRRGERLLLCVAGKAPHIDRRIGDFLRREARRELESRQPAFRADLGVALARVVVRDQASRWGSCSTAGVLSYSWRLMLAPC